MFDDVNRADFMYLGPKPRSKEAAVIMLADSAEAAVRSLPDNAGMRAGKDKLDTQRPHQRRDSLTNVIFPCWSFEAGCGITRRLSGVHHSRN